MKAVTILLLSLSVVSYAHALILNEVMSNPVGDDYGREWIELYNNSEDTIDLSSLSISIKGGTPVPVTLVSGGATVSPHDYAIIGSMVSGVTKFTQDYPNFTKPLFKSSISLVNTGVTSIEIKLVGQTVDTLASYTAAKEGSTYSLIGGTFTTGAPTPGEENKKDSSDDDNEATTTPPGEQGAIPQAAPPGSDIVLYLPFERIVVAGAPTTFSVFGLNHAGNSISNINYNWSFGDGGARTGSSTAYRYFYPGRYIAQVEGSNGLVSGVARMIVKVVSPEVSISPVEIGKYGSYIDITNPNAYDLDVSDWKLSIDDVPFSFPKNTLLPPGKTRFSGLAMGFASTTVSSSTIIKILFPTMEEVTRITQQKDLNYFSSKLTQNISSATQIALIPRKPSVKNISPKPILQPATSSSNHIIVNSDSKDRGIAAFLRSLFR